MTPEELHELEGKACPGAGACGGQFTANTMATVLTAMGMSPMGANDIPALDPRKSDAAFEVGQLILKVLEEDIRPSQIVTRKALENAVASVAATVLVTGKFKPSSSACDKQIPKSFLIHSTAKP